MCINMTRVLNYDPYLTWHEPLVNSMLWQETVFRASSMLWQESVVRTRCKIAVVNCSRRTQRRLEHRTGPLSTPCLRHCLLRHVSDSSPVKLSRYTKTTPLHVRKMPFRHLAFIAGQNWQLTCPEVSHCIYLNYLLITNMSK